MKNQSPDRCNSRFLPVYSSAEISKLMHHWIVGDLDRIDTGAAAMVGVSGCDRSPLGGMRALGLTQRFLSEDIDAAIEKMRNSQQLRLAAIFLLRYARGETVEDLAIALNSTVAQAQDAALESERQFLNHLL